MPTLLGGVALPVANGGTNATSASGTALDNITGFSSNGLLERTGAGAYSFDAVPLVVGKGGTGATTFTANALLKGNTTSAISASTVLDGGAGVTIGSPTGGAQGAGTLNATNLYVNGVAVGTSSVSVTSATPNTIVINPSPGTGTFTVGSTQGTQDCTSGTGACTGGAIVTGLNGAFVLLGAHTYTLAQAGTTGFASGWGLCLFNNQSSGDATINATTSTFVGYGGTTSIVLHPQAWACPASDGTNYQTIGASNLAAGTNVTVTRNNDGTTTIAATGGISGLTTNVIPKATSSTAIGNGSMTDNGGIIVGSPTGGAQGAGTLNATGLYVNGVAVGTGSGNVTASGMTSTHYALASSSTAITNGAMTDDGTKVSSTEPTVFNNTVSIANEGSTGTTVNKLAKLTGAPSTAVKIATTDMSGISGVVVSGGGTTGNALIARSGQATCTFDAATTAGDYVQASTSTAGDCHDAGSAYPTNGQVIGRVLSTNGAGGDFLINIIGAEVNASNPVATGSGGSVTLTGPQEVYFCTGTCTATLPALVVGQEYCVANNAAVTSVITLAALGGSAVYEKTDWSGYGTAGTGTLTSGGAAGDSICLHVLDTTHVQVMSSHGTWTAS